MLRALRESPKIAIVGGGPAGLRAAEVCAGEGAEVSLFEGKRSVGRKLLVAGYGGLNITHGEPLEAFVSRYSGPGIPRERFAQMIAGFSPAGMRRWAADLGIETFEQRTGRVYPREMKAAPLLRRWVERLRKLGVTFHAGHRLSDITITENRQRAEESSPTPMSPPHPTARHGVRLTFENGVVQSFDAVILALGGASWPKTGSDGGWISLFQEKGIRISPLEPANCGWEVAWPEPIVEHIEGCPLKNIAATAGNKRVSGEIMLTRYGMEAGAIYQLGPALRAMDKPSVTIDLKPEVPLENLVGKMNGAQADLPKAARRKLRLTDHAALLLDHFGGPFHTVDSLCYTVKHLPIPVVRPRPIAEAISSAGGVAWSELDEKLMLHKLPGVYTVGEMVDWEAPTGGYLIQGCLATATHAAKSCLGALQ